LVVYVILVLSIIYLVFGCIYYIVARHFQGRTILQDITQLWGFVHYCKRERKM